MHLKKKKKKKKICHSFFIPGGTKENLSWDIVGFLPGVQAWQLPHFQLPGVHYVRVAPTWIRAW